MKPFLFLAALLFFCLHGMAAPEKTCRPAEKILQIRVDEIGIISVGRDTISADKLARYIQERLFKSYMGTGEMHDRIRLEKTNDSVPVTVIEVVIAEIKSGQERALRELCTQQYNRPFTSLDPRKQNKLRKKFPVLFQTIIPI